MVIGDDFTKNTKIEIRLVERARQNNGAGRMRESSMAIIQPIELTRKSVKFLVPEHLPKGMYELRMYDGNVTEGKIVNMPKIHWIQGDDGRLSTVGGWIRIIGTCLRFTGEQPELKLVSLLAGDR